MKFVVVLSIPTTAAHQLPPWGDRGPSLLALGDL